MKKTQKSRLIFPFTNLKVALMCRYASVLSKGLVEGLRHDGIYVRPLGNVVYLMCGPLTNPESCSTLLQKLHAQLD